jgi:hypothetical protein
MVCELIIEALGNKMRLAIPPHIDQKIRKMRERIACRFGMIEVKNEYRSAS